MARREKLNALLFLLLHETWACLFGDDTYLPEATGRAPQWQGSWSLCSRKVSGFDRHNAELVRWAEQSADNFALLAMFAPISANVGFHVLVSRWPVLDFVLHTFYASRPIRSPYELRFLVELGQQALEKVHISDTGVWLPGKKQVFIPDDKLARIAAGKTPFDKLSNIRLTELVSGFKYDTIMQMWNRRHELHQRFLGIKRKGIDPASRQTAAREMFEFVKEDLGGADAVKAGFMTQLLTGSLGCIDIHNTDIYSAIAAHALAGKNTDKKSRANWQEVQSLIGKLTSHRDAEEQKKRLASYRTWPELLRQTLRKERAANAARNRSPNRRKEWPVPTDAEIEQRIKQQADAALGDIRRRGGTTPGDERLITRTNVSSDDYLRLLALLGEEGFGSAELWDNWTNFVAALWDKVMTGKNKVYATLQLSLAAGEAPWDRFLGKGIAVPKSPGAGWVVPDGEKYPSSLHAPWNKDVRFDVPLAPKKGGFQVSALHTIPVVAATHNADRIVDFLQVHMHPEGSPLRYASEITPFYLDAYGRMARRGADVGRLKTASGMSFRDFLRAKEEEERAGMTDKQRAAGVLPKVRQWHDLDARTLRYPAYDPSRFGVANKGTPDPRSRYFPPGHELR